MDKFFAKENRKSWGEGFSMVLIEDSIDSMILVKQALKMSGFDGQLDCYPFGRAYFEKHDGAPDLILCDLNLHGENGFEIYQHLERDGYDKHFILWTGNTYYLEESGAHNFDLDVIIKPIQPRELVEKIKACLK